MTRSPKIEQLSQKTRSDPRWSSIVARDASADGKFYYAFKTTGVYCRASARPAWCGQKTWSISRLAQERRKPDFVLASDAARSGRYFRTKRRQDREDLPPD
jgi:hypothetical protein